MNIKPKTIALYGKTFNQAILETLKLTYHHLLSLNLKILIEQSTAKALNIASDSKIGSNIDSNALTFETHNIPSNIDLIIVVGGDGSMLSASRFAFTQSIPVLGINLGNLGFLADITPDQIQPQLTEVLNGNYSVEERFLLSLTTENQKCAALNEITLTACNAPQLIEFEVYIDNQLMYQQRSDGLIIATPTGSTAYALSGGGPIVEPSLDAVVLVPMFPHTLNMRPIVISGESTIRIRAANTTCTSTNCLRLCCDGQSNLEISNNQIIKITKNIKHLKLVHPQGYNYYESLRSKLHWAKKPSSKVERN